MICDGSEDSSSFAALTSLGMTKKDVGRLLGMTKKDVGRLLGMTKKDVGRLLGMTKRM